jgi:hypothetical protein
MMATVTWFDLAGFIGVVLIVIAYLLLQLDKLPSSSLSYSLLNAAGALLISVSLLFKFNASAFLIEVFWFLISLLGLCKWFVSRKRLRIKEKTIMESNPLSEQQWFCRGVSLEDERGHKMRKIIAALQRQWTPLSRGLTANSIARWRKMKKPGKTSSRRSGR